MPRTSGTDAARAERRLPRPEIRPHPEEPASMRRIDPPRLRSLSILAGLPLAAAAVGQEVSGDWFRHPAISPDGSTIVFCHGGDLYTVPSGGGRAIPLSIHEAYESVPVWSPDGSMIAFASDRFGNDDVFVMPAGGGPATRLTHHSSGDTPSDFSPDGTRVLFSSARTDDVDSALFPSGVLAELYSVPVGGGTPSMVLTTPALNAVYNDAGDKILYEDRKGYEDELRKHHTSSIARDVWLYDAESGEHTKLTEFDGEDREPEWGSRGMYYLSERSGDFNVWRQPLEAGAEPEQLTRFEDHPVRHLSRADDGLMAFSWHGDLYTLRAGQEPRRLGVTIAVDGRGAEPELVTHRGGATEFAVAPSGKEVAFVVRGEVFVTSVDFSTTVRITDTPEQERSVSFSPDGRSLIYAGERDGSWNIYETTLEDDEELYFFSATKLSEKVVVGTDDDEFQPVYSPDGDRVAYLRERSELRVRDLESGDEVVAAPGDTFYSYSDGDHHFEWSPDGEWLALNHYARGRVFYTEVGMVKADGSGGLVDLSKSGYDDSRPHFAMGGEAVIWASDRYGERAHGSWGAEADVLGVFLNDDAYDRFRLSKEEYELKKELEEKKKEDEEETEETRDDDAGGDDKGDTDGDDGAEQEKQEDEEDEEKEQVEPIEVDLDGLDDRRVRLTQHASDLADYALSPDGDKLYYLAAVREGVRPLGARLPRGVGQDPRQAQRLVGGDGDDRGRGAHLPARGRVAVPDRHGRG
jgi:tricorn protease